jgi:fatty acid desaturase
MGSFAFAVFGWLFGALGHDAGHFSASRIPYVNDAGVWAMCLLANPVVWQYQHTYAHHSHTNSIEHDPDLHHFETLLRVHRKFPLRDRYKLQSSAAFVVVAWALVVVGTCFWIPWGVLQSSSLYGMVPVSRPWGMYVHFVAYFGVIMVAPFFSHATAGGAVLAVLTHMFTSGLLFAFFSQINHLNEHSLDSDATTSKSWAKAQVETSNNFAPDSYAWHVLSNGLNLQIEHHLFPGLNHCHLHHIAPVVRQTCLEHGVQYKSYGSWREIVHATLTWLDRLSKEP